MTGFLRLPFRLPLATVLTVAVGWPGLADAAEMVDPLSSTYLIKLVISLFLVIGLMFVVVWLLKRTGRFDGRARHYPMRVLTQMSIGQRERVLLIEVGDRQMLLGVAGGSVESLGWVDPPIAPEQGMTDTLQPDSPFGKLLQRQMAGRRSQDKTAASGRESAGGSQIDTDVLDVTDEERSNRRMDDANGRS